MASQKMGSENKVGYELRERQKTGYENKEGEAAASHSMDDEDGASHSIVPKVGDQVLVWWKGISPGPFEGIVSETYHAIDRGDRPVLRYVVRYGDGDTMTHEVGELRLKIVRERALPGSAAAAEGGVSIGRLRHRR